MTDQPPTPAVPKIDTTVPNSARVWNYWLGGRDHYEIDRVAGYHFRVMFPEIIDIARADRAFLGRVVGYLAGEAGIRQILDIGAGLPTEDNTHEVAQRIAPQSRVVYVDNDPLVIAYARALLTGSPEGATDYVEADMRDPRAILREAARTLDLGKPTGLLLMNVLGHIGDYGQARTVVATLLDGLAPGSYLAIGDATGTSDRHEQALRRYAETGAAPYHTRTQEEFAGFFDGLDVVDPGVVLLPHWRPGAGPAAGPAAVPHLGAVGRKG